MRLIRRLTIAALCFGLAGSALAQSRQDFERCRAINDDLRRLGCYDGIAISGAPPSRGRYETVPLPELTADALGFRGRFVEVTGWIAPSEDLFLLKADEAAAEGLPVDPRALSRAERQAFLDDCSAGCAATIQGSVRPVGFTTGILADALIRN